MKPDLDQYMTHLEEFNLSSNQKRELLIELWKVIEIFVDLGFGIEATQLVLLENQMNPSKQAKDSLRFEFNQKSSNVKKHKKRGFDL